MLKKTVVLAGLVASLMASSAWAAGNVPGCLHVTTPSDWGGKKALENICNYDIEVHWCIGRGQMCYDYDNTWTIHANAKFPIDAKDGDHVMFDGCKGANSPSTGNSFATFRCK